MTKTNMTVTEANANLEKILERYHIETFFDAAEICGTLKVFADSVLVLAENDPEEYDEKTQTYLIYLSQLLEHAVSKFFKCDPYYR